MACDVISGGRGGAGQARGREARAREAGNGSKRSSVGGRGRVSSVTQVVLGVSSSRRRRAADRRSRSDTRAFDAGGSSVAAGGVRPLPTRTMHAIISRVWWRRVTTRHLSAFTRADSLPLPPRHTHNDADCYADCDADCDADCVMVTVLTVMTSRWRRRSSRSRRRCAPPRSAPSVRPVAPVLFFCHACPAGRGVVGEGGGAVVVQ